MLPNTGILFGIRNFSPPPHASSPFYAMIWRNISPETGIPRGFRSLSGIFPMTDPKTPSTHPYTKPAFNVLTRLQAALLLLGRAWDGDKNAKELLEKCADVLFPPTHNNE
jgi:hypothetical protein